MAALRALLLDAPGSDYWELKEFLGMKKIGEDSRRHLLDYFFEHHGRVFQFYISEELHVTEYFLGERVETVDAVTKVNWDKHLTDILGWCSLGDDFLMILGGKGICALLLKVDEGKLISGAVHVTSLTVTGEQAWEVPSFLCQVTETRALLCFLKTNRLLYCDLIGNGLVLKLLNTKAPVSWKCKPSVICLSDRQLLMTGLSSRSTDISLIVCEDEPRFERLGDIPGLPMQKSSIVLLKNRFVVGFGGDEHTRFTELWIFDVQTRASSFIWEKGDWTLENNSVLVAGDDTLFLIGYGVHSITFQALSELIDNIAVRAAFCNAFGFSLASKYTLPSAMRPLLSGMESISVELPGTPCNTVQLNGRLFHIRLSENELLLSEVVFYEKRARLITVGTGVFMGNMAVGCCAFGDQILVMSAQESAADGAEKSERAGDCDEGSGASKPGQVHTTTKVFAALIIVQKGQLSKETFQFSQLSVTGDEEWLGLPYLCQVSKNRVFLHFYNESDMWYCDISCDTLILRKLKTSMPTRFGFCVLPIYLSEGKLLVAGAYPESTDITLIICEDEPRFERVGTMLGAPRVSTSTVLFMERFVIGCGGATNVRRGHKFTLLEWINSLWIFDLQTSRISGVRKAGDWCCTGEDILLVIREGILYLFGVDNGGSRILSLAVLGALIEDDEVRAAFRSSFLAYPLVYQSGTGFLSHIPQFQEKLSYAEYEINELQKKLDAATAELKRLTPPAGTIQITLPFLKLPTLSFPQRWRARPKELQDLVASMSAHKTSLTQQPGFLQEYRRTFGPLLDGSLPRRIASAASSVPSQRARDQAVAQVAASSSPNQFFPPSAGTLSLRKRHPLRLEDKLVDSVETVIAMRVSSPSTKILDRLQRRAPPIWEALVARVERRDPLRVEALHQSTVTLRKVFCISWLATETFRALQKWERFGEARRAGRQREELDIPWLRDGRDHPGLPLARRSEEAGKE